MDEERAAISWDSARMIMDQTGMPVPKFRVMGNGSFGGGNHDICSCASDSGLLLIWPNHWGRVMAGDEATNALAEVNIGHLSRDFEDIDATATAKFRDKASETRLCRILCPGAFSYAIGKRSSNMMAN
ncbi:MAG: hypothetical protein H5U17_04345 [Defluviimonas sp.]|nr:hypothetical protein [Defluviimonas sp.]